MNKQVINILGSFIIEYTQNKNCKKQEKCGCEFSIPTILPDIIDSLCWAWHDSEIDIGLGDYLFIMGVNNNTLRVEGIK